ncbi:hypothetical protein GCM10010269_83460 [Streptomyces humidus]|uniref:Uncharacterized protein n=1 Tax=Streptomyces humidus TaxID=52259 RepID=A0A918GF03_9ACTN|nr:hypothetical protein [Streptomyces humidus]GGS32637.1 hypothetical protein GCM10010269_83460 [Streptomyces humidus]
MTHLAHERELDDTRRTPAGAAGRTDAGRPRSELWEFLGMALVASGLCLAVLHPELHDDVVHMLATRAVDLVR